MFGMLQVTKNILKTLFVFIAVVGVIAFFIFTDKQQFLFFLCGLLLGGFLCVGGLFSLQKTIDKSLTLNQDKAQNYTKLMFVLRYATAFGLLVMVALFSPIALYGAAIGLFALKPSVYIANFVSKKQNIHQNE